jgi:hypothetical protein
MSSQFRTEDRGEPSSAARRASNSSMRETDCTANVLNDPKCVKHSTHFRNSQFDNICH